MTLAEFLRARLDEDEEAALAASRPPTRVDIPADAQIHSADPSTENPTHWGWGGGPVRVADFDPKVVEALDLKDRDDPYHVSVRGTWDEGEPIGARYDVAVVPADHDAGRHIARHDPARVLAEVAAKRRLMNHAIYMTQWTDEHQAGVSEHEIRMMRIAGEHVLRLVASPYADHPDYRHGWFPRG
jgi:hypothetical protein